MRTTQWIVTTVGALVIAVLSTAQLAAQTTPQGGPSEGIKVHGHWTLDITNPDGTPAGRYEFENALQETGGLNIATFLGRVNSPGSWVVFLYSPSGTPNCIAGSAACVMAENTSLISGSAPLSVTVPSSGPNQGRLVLNGSFTSPDARTFFRAISGVRLCPAGAPGCQPGSIGGNFTLKDFPEVAVQAGQLVQVTVVISFS